MIRYFTLTHLRGFDSCLVPSSCMLVIFYLCIEVFLSLLVLELNCASIEFILRAFATLSKKKNKKTANEFIGPAMRFPWFFFFLKVTIRFVWFPERHYTDPPTTKPLYSGEHGRRKIGSLYLYLMHEPALTNIT